MWRAIQKNWRKLSKTIDFDALAERKRDFYIKAPDFYAQWRMIDGRCELSTVEGASQLHEPLLKKIMLNDYPNLSICDIPVSNYAQSLWSQRTKFKSIAFSGIQMHLNASHYIWTDLKIPPKLLFWWLPYKFQKKQRFGKFRKNEWNFCFSMW